MRTGIITAALAALFIITAPAHAEGVDGYFGVLGVGASLTQPLVDNFEWGGKVEAGYLGKWFGTSAQGLVRYNIPVENVPVFVQLGLGAHLEFDGKLSPWGSLAFGARFDKWNVLLQLPGYPVIGLSFPL